MPILFSALACLLIQGLPSLLALDGGAEGYIFAATAGCCCGGFGSLPLGMVTALVAYRRDPMMLPVHGFSVAFIGIGIGQAILALVQFMQFRKVDLVEVKLIMRDAAHEGLVTQDKTMSAQEVDEGLDMIVSAMSWTWAATAGATTIFAALVGMLTIVILQSRRKAS